MKHKPNHLVITVQCDRVTGEADVEAWPGQFIAPESIIVAFTADVEHGCWDVRAAVQGRMRLVRGGLSKNLHDLAFWAKNGEGTLEAAPEWVRDWVRHNTPALSLIPEWVG